MASTLVKAVEAEVKMQIERRWSCLKRFVSMSSAPMDHHSQQQDARIDHRKLSVSASRS